MNDVWSSEADRDSDRKGVNLGQGGGLVMRGWVWLGRWVKGGKRVGQAGPTTGGGGCGSRRGTESPASRRYGRTRKKFIRGKPSMKKHLRRTGSTGDGIQAMRMTIRSSA